MKTKLVELRDGSKTTLFKNEVTGRWVTSKEKAVDVFHELILDAKEPTKMVRVIRRYYSETTNEYTREKIREMVNRDPERNVVLLYDTILNEILLRN